MPRRRAIHTMSKLLCTLALTLGIAAASALAAEPQAAPAIATTVSPPVRAAITATLASMAPGSRVQVLQPAPIPGLYQAVVQGQVLYLTGDGRYVIQGEAFDARARSSLNAATMDRLRREAIAQLAPDRMLRFAPAHPKYTVTIFTDVDCPYCRALHAQITEINALGIAVDYLFFPRTGLGTPSAQKAVDVWCAPDRKAAIAAAFQGEALREGTCASPVAHDFNLGVELGVDGTPAIIAPSGAVLGGYLTPAELLRRLQAAAAPAGATPAR